MGEQSNQDQLTPPINLVLSNLYALFQSFSLSKSVEVAHNDDIYRWHTNINHPWFEGLLVSRPRQAGDERFVQETIQYFSRLQAIPFSWWFSPEVDQTGWTELLVKNNFKQAKDTPGMVLDLKDLPASPGIPPGLTIQVLENPSDIPEWCQVFIQGYELPEAFAPGLINLITAQGLHLPFRFYQGWYNGEIVATSTSILSGDTIGIYNVATISQYRGLGIGKAMTLEPLIASANTGAHWGILQSSSMGFPVYKKIGFKHVGNLEYYYWNGM
jgi:ribosomal protein S18 acetylase RimI-like enzyme